MKKQIYSIMNTQLSVMCMHVYLYICENDLSLRVEDVKESTVTVGGIGERTEWKRKKNTVSTQREKL